MTKGEIDCGANAAADPPDTGGGDIRNEIMGQTVAEELSGEMREGRGGGTGSTDMTKVLSGH